MYCEHSAKWDNSRRQVGKSTYMYTSISLQLQKFKLEKTFKVIKSSC